MGLSLSFILILLFNLQPDLLQADCLSCHQESSKGLSQYHNQQLVSCDQCHLGNPKTKDKNQAHQGLEIHPGNSSTLQLTCGKSSCHQEISSHFQSNIMNTLKGMVTLTRKVFKEKPTPLANLHQLKKTGADSYLRKLCVSCHLGGSKKTKNHPIKNRGGGCSACHLNRSQGAVHPTLNLKIDNDKCLGCHSRSARISLSYIGLAEIDTKGAEKLPRHGYLPDKRLVEQKPADIHHLAGMVCIDCHTVNGVMGKGEKAATLKDQLDIQCNDCHGVKPETKKWSDLSRRDLVRRALYNKKLGVEQSDRVIVTQKGRTPLFHLYPSGEKRVLQLKLSGLQKVVPLAKAGIHHQLKGHERLSCESCHSSWTPNCYGCHISYDSQEKQYDHLLKKKTAGRWKEHRWAVINRLPTLGVTSENRITTFIPGMNLTVDGGTQTAKIKTRTFASYSPHTIQKNSRSCISCHQNEEALGIIKKWETSPDNPQWSTPIGWIEKDSTTTGKALRKGGRSFNKVEIDKILFVGNCLNCHQPKDSIFSQFAISKKRMKPVCRSNHQK
jgi:hypothetical protein